LRYCGSGRKDGLCRGQTKGCDFLIGAVRKGLDKFALI
jgi:hypothetical protein